MISAPGQIVGYYDPSLVALSVVIAILASYTALNLAARVTANVGGQRVAWLLGGSVAMGTGIWSMHYVGMLAFALPISVQYDWPTVLLSLLAAVLSSLVALWVVSLATVGYGRTLGASMLMGSGIAGMHYIGMAAMRLQAICHYSGSVVAFSAGLAVAISFVALRFAFHFREDRSHRFWKKFASSIIMGSAIPVMHYTGMAAVRFSRTNLHRDPAHSIGISSLGVTSIIVVSFMALGLTLLLALFDRRFSAQALALADSEQRYRELVESARVVLWRSDSDIRRFSFVSREAETVLGYPVSDWLAGDSFWHDHLHPEDRELVAARHAAVPGIALSPFEHRMRSADGESIWVRTALRLVETESGPEVIGLMLDITERKRAEEALDQQRRLFDALMDASPDCIYFKDTESRFVRINKAQAKIFELAEPEMALGKSDADFFSEDHWRQALADECTIMKTGQPLIDFEEKETWPDGRVTWVSSTKMARLDYDGNVCGTIGVSRDITERKLVQHRLEERTEQLVRINGELEREMRERQLLEGQLLQAQKLESIGQLAAGIAHEINTPIQYVGDNCRFIEESFVQLSRVLDEYSALLHSARETNFDTQTVRKIENSIEESDLAYLLNEIPRAISQCQEGIERIAVIVRAMKEFSYPGSKDMKRIDLNRAVENTLIVCRNEWKLVADAESRLDPSLPPVACLANELNQVILNLIVNAAHAIADAGKGETKGKITVSTKRDGSFVELRVKDDGTGIPEAIQSRIFDPFFTTKEVGRGTGQGLAISRNVIVNKHGGSLTFEASPDCGTTFIVRLPIERPSGHSKQSLPENEKAGGRQ